MVDFVGWILGNLPENPVFWLVALAVVGLVLLAAFLETRAIARKRRRWTALLAALEDLDGVPYKSFSRRRTNTIFLGTKTDLAKATGRLITDN